MCSVHYIKSTKKSCHESACSCNPSMYPNQISEHLTSQSKITNHHHNHLLPTNKQKSRLKHFLSSLFEMINQVGLDNSGPLCRRMTGVFIWNVVGGQGNILSLLLLLLIVLLHIAILNCVIFHAVCSFTLLYTVCNFTNVFFSGNFTHCVLHYSNFTLFACSVSFYMQQLFCSRISFGVIFAFQAQVQE